MIAETTAKVTMLFAKLDQNPTMEVSEQSLLLVFEMHSHLEKVQYLERKWQELVD